MPGISQKTEILPSWLLSINRVWIGLLFLILLGSLTLSHNKSNAENPITIEGLYKCTNSIRSDHQQKRLFLSEQLNRAAFHKLVDMETYKYWAHQNPSTGARGWEFIDQSGYYYQIAGENLAIGFPSSEGVCEAWRQSPSHFKNMIDPDFLEVGFAFEEVDLGNNKSGVLVVQLFATKAGFEKDYQQPPACTTTIDRGLRVITPGCGVLETQENTLTLFNPRKQAVKITVDGEERPFIEEQKGRFTSYTFDQVFSPGSHEIKVKRTDNNGSTSSKTAQIKFIVETPQTGQIGRTVHSIPLLHSIFHF